MAYKPYRINESSNMNSKYYIHIYDNNVITKEEYNNLLDSTNYVILEYSNIDYDQYIGINKNDKQKYLLNVHLDLTNVEEKYKEDLFKGYFENVGFTSEFYDDIHLHKRILTKSKDDDPLYNNIEDGISNIGVFGESNIKGWKNMLNIVFNSGTIIEEDVQKLLLKTYLANKLTIKYSDESKGNYEYDDLDKMINKLVSERFETIDGNINDVISDFVYNNPIDKW